MTISKDELNKILEVKVDVEKVTSISSDGNNLLTRIPKNIVDYLKLQKGQKIRWLVNGKTDEIKLEVIRENGISNKAKKSS